MGGDRAVPMDTRHSGLSILMCFNTTIALEGLTTVR